MKHILKHFEKVDGVMAGLARRHKIKKSRRPTENRFEYLALTILYQQLSTKAASTIAGRFRALYQPLHNSHLKTLSVPKRDISPKGGENQRNASAFPMPEEILKTPDEMLRAVGISWQKIKYIKDLADKVASKHINIETLEQLPDEEVIAELTKVKGIGRWTAEMFLMSALARPDIFSLGDLGLRTAIKKAYGYKKLPSDRTVIKHSKLWSPYRTYAARVLWASLDNE